MNSMSNTSSPSGSPLFSRISKSVAAAACRHSKVSVLILRRETCNEEDQNDRVW